MASTRRRLPQAVSADFVGTLPGGNRRVKSPLGALSRHGALEVHRGCRPSGAKRARDCERRVFAMGFVERFGG